MLLCLGIALDNTVCMHAHHTVFVKLVVHLFAFHMCSQVINSALCVGVSKTLSCFLCTPLPHSNQPTEQTNKQVSCERSSQRSRDVIRDL